LSVTVLGEDLQTVNCCCIQKIVHLQFCRWHWRWLSVARCWRWKWWEWWWGGKCEWELSRNISFQLML
jgi:hypothetical protein